MSTDGVMPRAEAIGTTLPARRPGALTNAASTTLALLRTIVRHPLNRHRPGRAVSRWILWHVAARIAPGAIAVPFVEATRLLMRPGDRGLTLNHYLGLAEFEEMAFALHYLEQDDLFVDVGANAGAYTVLASGATGARTIACEPDPDAIARLRDNVALNGLGGRVELHATAVGATIGEIAVTRGHGPMNQVVTTTDPGAALVPLTTLDALLAGRRARLIKIDVEGHEPRVIAGAATSLAKGLVDALIIEVARGRQAGPVDGSILPALGTGWTRVHYAPLERRLAPATGPLTPGNHIFVRNLAEAQARVGRSPRRQVAGRLL